MRIKSSRSRDAKIKLAPLPQRRKRRGSLGSRGRQPDLVPVKVDSETALEPMQWVAFACISVAAIALIGLLWILTQRTIDEQTAEIRGRTDQYIRSVAFVLAREVQDELALVDQSLTIIQEDWKKNSDTVDLGQWRKQASALTSVAHDIFIADDQGVIVQGTIPQSVGMGFGSAYVTYPNGGLEVYGADGTKDPDGKIPGSNVTDKVEARQFLIYVVRPLEKPKYWLVGASYRSEGITRLFAGAKLGAGGIVGLADTSRGALVAIVGSSAQLSQMDISKSSFAELIRKNDAGVWTGESPTDGMFRVIAYQRIPGRNMSVVAGIGVTSTLQTISGTIAWARGVALLGSIAVLSVAAIFIWTLATVKRLRQRRRNAERTELNLMNARLELALSRVQAKLTEPEVGTLMSSAVDGVARLDDAQRLRVWNPRFVALVGVPLDASAAGMKAEDLLRRQAAAGLFGDPAGADDLVANRLTVLHTGGQSVAPPVQTGPLGEQIAMHVRGVVDGGNVIVLASAENARFAALPPLESEDRPETVEEATDW